MTAVEHIVAWIESSRAHYEQLIELERDKGFDSRFNSSRAHRALNIASSAYSEAVRDGDMFASEHSPETILDAAKALLAWELEQ